MITYINQTDRNEWDKYEERFNEIFTQTLKTLQIDKDYEVSIILVDANQIHEINRDYRNIDRPTDVISFALCDDKDIVQTDELGDIFICLDRAFEQASEYGHSVEREVAFLAVHGYLHLCGFDHMTKEDEEVMFKKQDEILNAAKLERK